MIPRFEMKHRLRLAREAAGFEQIPFAENIGVSRATITNYENGHVAPRRIVINAWALASGVPVEWLLHGIVPEDEHGGAVPKIAVGDQRARRDSNPQPSGWESERTRTASTSNIIPIGRKAARAPLVVEAVSA